MSKKTKGSLQEFIYRLNQIERGLYQRIKANLINQRLTEAGNDRQAAKKIKNLLTLRDIRDKKEYFRIIAWLFFWEASPEGQDYWLNIYTQLRDRKD